MFLDFKLIRLSLKVGRGRGDGDAGTRVWDTGLRDARPGTWGRVYGGTWGRGDVGTRELGDVGTWERGDARTGTRRCQDRGREIGDAER